MGEFVGDLTCVYCDEPLDGLDAGLLINDGTQPVHRDCLLRMVVGSLGHQKHLCPCCGGNEDDPPGMTKREAARAAAQYFEHSQAGGMECAEDTVLEGDCNA